MDEERVGQGLDHLQAAALEMIAAARAFLDVAEEWVSDRDKVAEVVHVVGSAAQGAARVIRDEPNPAGDPADGVQHIRVS